MLDAASLWVFVAAFSHFISPVDLLMAYGLANILAAIPITPGGLGVVEFVLVSMITGFGPTAGQALSAVLAYRAVNFWLPIPFGGLAYASLEFERRPVLPQGPGVPPPPRPPASEGGLAAEPSTSPAGAALSDVAATSAADHAAGAVPGGRVGRGIRDLEDERDRSRGRHRPRRRAGRWRPVRKRLGDRSRLRSGGPRVPSGARHGETGGIRGPAFGTDPAG